MSCEDARQWFGAYHLASQSDVLRRIERRLCGCDYGATSLSTREQADRLAGLLKLTPGSRLLDIGSGAGWPALYMAQQAGCEAALTDLPLAGLRIAAARAAIEGPDRCWVAVADGARLPFADASFDAISHADALCCLPAKLEVLRECRRLVRSGGRMAFIVISIVPGLSMSQRRRAIEAGPEFIEADADYSVLLGQAGWALRERVDLTAQFADSCADWVAAFEQEKPELAEVMGATAWSERRDKLAGERDAARQGLLRREMLMATPR